MNLKDIELKGLCISSQLGNAALLACLLAELRHVLHILSHKTVFKHQISWDDVVVDEYFFLSLFFELEPPSFVKKIENVTALAGDSITLQAVVKGSEPISVMWMKGKDIIQDDNKVRVTFEHGLATLQITGVQLSSGGKYTCVAENDAGSQSCFGELAVKGQWSSVVTTALSLT